MRAAVIPAAGTLRVIEVPDPVPAVGEALIEPALTGICGTDLHILDGDFATARYPVTPGHELTGTVVALGLGVTSVQVGDRVVVDPGIPCGVCLLCRRGQLNLCANREAIGVTRPGGAAERVVVPAANCHAFGADVDFAAAILCEPLACVLHAVDRVPAVAGQRALVYGAGTIGLLTVQVLRRIGTHRIDVVDTNPARLPGATAVGADSARGPGDLGSQDDWDLVVDASGSVAAIADGLSRLQRGGTFLQVGVANGEATVPVSPHQIFARELTIVGSLTTRYTFTHALRLLADGIIDTELIVQQPLPLAQYAEAIERVRSGLSLKVVVGRGS